MRTWKNCIFHNIKGKIFTLIWKIECVAQSSTGLICQCRAIFWPSRLLGGTFLTFEGRLLESEQIFILKAVKNDKKTKLKAKIVFKLSCKIILFDELATLIARGYYITQAPISGIEGPPQSCVRTSTMTGPKSTELAFDSTSSWWMPPWTALVTHASMLLAKFLMLWVRGLGIGDRTLGMKKSTIFW